MLQTPTIDIEEVKAEEEEEQDWMTPYRNFLIQGVLPSDENEVQCLKQKASYYVIFDGKLFKRGLTSTQMPKEQIYILHRARTL